MLGASQPLGCDPVSVSLSVTAVGLSPEASLTSVCVACDKKKFSSGNEGGGVKPVIIGPIPIFMSLAHFHCMGIRYVCRKCGISFDSSEIDSWQDLNDIQTMTCGAGGVHRLIGRR